MQKKLQQLEDKINQILLRLWAVFVALIHKIIPQKVFDAKKRLKVNTKAAILTTIEKTKNLLIKMKNKLVVWKNFVMEKIDAIQKFPIKEKTFAKLRVFKEYLLHTPLKQHTLWLSQKLKILNEKTSKIIDAVGKQQLSIALGAISMIAIGIVSIYDSSRDIYKNEFTSRSPASAQEYDEKPPYYMFKRKTATIFKIQVPIFRENVKEVRNITIDFTVRTSTRFAKQYLEFHTQKLKDYFFTTVEPVTSSFPLEEEGKIVLKEKILYELNNFLLQENVEGVVEEVNLIYSVGY